MSEEDNNRAGQEGETDGPTTSPVPRQSSSGDNIKIAIAAAPAATTASASSSVPEVPRWRFVNTAKKSLGYSSQFAGSHIQGKSADELAAKYQAPADEDDSDVNHIGEVEIGKVAVPSFMLGKDVVEESYEVNLARRSKAAASDAPLKSGASAAVDASFNDVPQPPLPSQADGTKQQQQHHELKQLEQDVKRMEQEHLQLQMDIREGELRKMSLERETQAVRQEKDELIRERDAAAATLPVGAPGSSASAAPTETPPDEKRKRCKKWGVIALILLLLSAIGALLGVMLGGNSSSSSSNETDGLRGPVGETTSKPTLVPTIPLTLSPVEGGKPQLTPPPTIPSTTFSTGLSSIVSIPTMDDSDETTQESSSMITCPPTNKKFTLTINLPPNPAPITWNIMDKCTSKEYYRCEECYANSPPNAPVAFSGCLPKSPEFMLRLADANGIEAADGNGNGVFGEEGDEYFEIWYEGEVEAQKGYVDSSNNYVSFVHFGEGGGCSENPEPTQLPSRSPSQPLPMPGCTAFETSGGCAREAEVQFEVLMQRGFETFDNRGFGAAVTFVGDTQSIIALGSSSPGSYVHIFKKANTALPDGKFSWNHLTLLQLPDSAEANSIFFGASLDSNDEGYIAVGAPSASSSQDAKPGKVYVFQPNSEYTDWSMVATLESDDDVPDFGASLAMDGTLVAVGSPKERNGKGSVYVFAHSGPLNLGNTWALSDKLTPNGVADGAGFGSSVSLFGDAPFTLAVGAPGDAGGGSAWVFKRADDSEDFDWSTQKLIPRDVQEGDRYGSSVVISGCTVAVSSPGEGVVGADTTTRRTSGTVRMFEWDADADYWVHRQIVEPIDDLAGAIFGECISLEGDTLLVGSPWGREGNEQSGVVYNYKRIGSRWSPIPSIVQEGHIAGDADEFACPLSLSGDMFIVGSPGDATLGMNSGAAYIVDLCPTLSEEV